MLCDSPLYVSVGVGANYSRIRKDLFSACASDLKNADITIGNFEGVVCHPKKKNLQELQMACEENTIKDLKLNGFNILNLANNHCLQHGTNNFFRTKAVCEQNGIHVSGIKGESPYVIGINGIKLAFLSLCVHYEWYEPNDIQYEDNIERIFSETIKIKNKDPKTIIVISVHWGDEFSTFPSNAQIALAHKFVELGANIILGHHSHVYQGIEKYKGSLIVYGQGNFISDMIPVLCRQTGIVQITITENDNNYDMDYELIPYYINDNLIPEISNSAWFTDRQRELELAVNNKFSDDYYWQKVSQNHRECHDAFSKFFLRHIGSYKVNISWKMIFEFIRRKLDKVTGNSSFGRKGSMEQEIYAALERTGKRI